MGRLLESPRPNLDAGPGKAERTSLAPAPFPSDRDRAPTPYPTLLGGTSVLAAVDSNTDSAVSIKDTDAFAELTETAAVSLILHLSPPPTTLPYRTRSTSFLTRSELVPLFTTSGREHCAATFHSMMFIQGNTACTPLAATSAKGMRRVRKKYDWKKCTAAHSPLCSCLVFCVFSSLPFR